MTNIIQLCERCGKEMLFISKSKIFKNQNICNDCKTTAVMTDEKLMQILHNDKPSLIRKPPGKRTALLLKMLKKGPVSRKEIEYLGMDGGLYFIKRHYPIRIVKKVEKSRGQFYGRYCDTLFAFEKDFEKAKGLAEKRFIDWLMKRRNEMLKTPNTTKKRIQNKNRKKKWCYDIMTKKENGLQKKSNNTYYNSELYYKKQLQKKYIEKIQDLWFKREITTKELKQQGEKIMTLSIKELEGKE